MTRPRAFWLRDVLGPAPGTPPLSWCCLPISGWHCVAFLKCAFKMQSPCFKKVPDTTEIILKISSWNKYEKFLPPQPTGTKCSASGTKGTPNRRTSVPGCSGPAGARTAQAPAPAPPPARAAVPHRATLFPSNCVPWKHFFSQSWGPQVKSHECCFTSHMFWLRAGGKRCISLLFT